MWSSLCSWRRSLFGLIRNGTTQRCYDGQYFFDTDHHPADPENPAAGIVANADMTGAMPGWVLLDTTKVVKPFIFQKRKDYTFIRGRHAQAAEPRYLALQGCTGAGRCPWMA